MATVTERVNSILKQRKERVPQVTEKIKNLKEIQERILAFERFKNSVVGDDGYLIPNCKYYNILANKPEMISNLSNISFNSLKSNLENLIEKYIELEERFSREFINISVVGPARQGKSRFLQSISGLDDRCIPAFTGGHCTGASSTIENGDNEAVCVELTYKTEKEIRDEIQGYLDIITKGNEIIVSSSELPRISKEKLDGWVEKYNKKNENTEAEDAKKLVYDRYVKHYNDWKDLIGKPVEAMYDEDVIMTYVAQHNGKGKFLKDGSKNPEFLEFYKFVAVKSARIVKIFKHEDCGKIKMIDTVGLGSTENNVEANMIDVIKHESDGVIFFKRPEGSTKGTDDKSLANIYSRIKKEFYDRKMEKWFSYVINHTAESEYYKDNLAMCMELESEVTELLPLLSANILDVSDPDKVRDEFLIPYLTALSKNIDEIDSIFVKEVNDFALNVYDEYKVFYTKVEKAIKGEAKNSDAWMMTFDSLFKNVYDTNMIGVLKRYLIEWRNKKVIECHVFDNVLSDICRGIPDCIPSEEKIAEIFILNPRKNANDVWMEQLNKMRTDLTAQFLNVDLCLSELITEFKNYIVTALTENGKLGCIVEVDESKPKNEWLADFITEALNDEKHPEIKRAFEFLYNFDISVRGFMMHKVRICMDMINPDIPQAAQAPFTNVSSLSIEKQINNQLRIRMKAVQDSLNISLKEFSRIPNEAFYATIDEFYDRISFSENVEKEWKDLYYQYSGTIWSSELQAIAASENAVADWNDMVSSLAQKTQKSNFVLNIA